MGWSLSQVVFPVTFNVFAFSQLGITISDLNIFRMPDPDRGQGVLPFEPVGRQEEEEED